MKKLFTFSLLITILVASIFAEATYTDFTITLNAKVPITAPLFTFYGSLTPEFTNSVEGNSNIDAVGDPAEDDIIVYFKLVQSNLARYKGSFNITFSATTFSATIEETLYETSVPKAFLGGYPIDTEIAAVTIDDTASATGVYKGKLSYKKANPVVENTYIMGVNFKWDKNAELPTSDDYMASVTVIVETV